MINSPGRDGEVQYEASPAEKTSTSGLRFVRIPAGEFVMGGSETAEELVEAFSAYRRPAEFFKDEYPQHRVKITKLLLG